MGVKHLTYLDLTVEQRREAANAARGRLQSHLSNPTLTPAQQGVIMAQLTDLDRWEAGTLPIGGAATPNAHVVEIKEVIEVKEG